MVRAPITRTRDRYSRFVGLAKYGLPILGIVLLSLLFLLAREIDPQASLDEATIDVDDRIEEPKLTGPSYSGVTEDGATISVSAESITPHSVDYSNATIAAPRAEYIMSDGQVIRVQSQNAELTAGTKLGLYGAVELTTSDGYRMTAGGLDLDLDLTHLVSDGAVHVTGPIGELTAGKMEITAENRGNNPQLLFTGGVKLIYDPKHAKTGAAEQ